MSLPRRRILSPVSRIPGLAPLSPVDPRTLMSGGLRDGMQEQERAYEQQDILAERQAIAAERQQIAAERAAGVAQRAADRQATTTQNFAKTLEFDAQAIQHRTNPVTKTVEAVNDPLTGLPNARDLKGPVEYDPTGRAVQTIRKDGVFKVEDLDASADIGRNPEDKNDPNIYVKNKARKWDAFAPNDALVHPDTRIRNEAAKTLMREDADKLTAEERTLRAELSHPDYDGVTQAKIDEAQKRKAGGYSTPEYDAILSKADTIRQKKERLSQIGIEQATQGTMTAEEFAAKRLASMDPAAVNAPRQKLLEAQRAGITAIKTKLDAEDAQYAADYEAFLPRTKNFLPQDAPAIREQMGQMTLRKQMIDAKRRSLEEDVAKHDTFIKSLNEQAATRQAATVAASAVGAPQTDKKPVTKAPESVPFEKALTEAKAGTLPWSKVMDGEKARLDMLRADGSAPETVKAMDRAVRVLSSMDPANGEDEQGIIQAQRMFGAEVAKAAEKDAATQEANRAKAAAAYANVIAPRDEMDSLPDEEQFRLSQEHQKANFLGKHEDAPAFYSKEFGSLNVNPRLVFKPDEYTKAVEAADAPPLAKEKAMQALPLMQQEAAKPVFQAFNENPVIAEAFYASKAKTAKRLGAPGISTASHPQEQAEAVADFMASPDFSPNWNQVVLGVSRGLSGLRQSVAGVGSFFGSDTAQRSGEKEIAAQQREGAAAAAGGGSELLGSLASGATSLVPSIGVGVVTGGAGFGAQGALAASAAAAGAQSGGATMIEAKKAGMGEMQSRLTSLASGAITAGLTRAGGTTGAEAVLSKLFAPGKEATLSVVKPALVKAMVEKMKGYAVEGAKEVLEEVPDQLLQNVLAGATYKPGQDSAEGLVDTAIVSFLLGGGVNAATDVAGGVKAKFNAEKEIKSATVRRELGQQIAAQHSPAIITETLAGSPIEERTPEVLSKIAEFDARIVDGQEQLAGAKSKAQTLYSNNQLAQAYGQREEYIAGIRSELRDSFVSAAEQEIDGAQPPAITDANGLETPGDAAAFEQDKARAKALVAIAGGKVESLDNKALALVGLSRGPDGALKAGGKSDAPDGAARVTIEKGELVIGQSTIDRMTELFPATAPLIGQSEEERRAAVIANVTAAEAARQPAPGGETAPETAGSTPPQVKPVVVKPGQDATFEVEIDDVADPVTITAASREDAEVAAMRQYPGKMIRSVTAVAPVTAKVSPVPSAKITKAPEVIPTGKDSLQVAPKEAVKPAAPAGISPASIAKAITSASGRRPSKKEAVRYQAVAKALSKEATRWQAAFPGGFTTTQNSGSGGVQVDSGTATPSLRLDFKALAESVDALGSNSLQWVERAIQEEVIHSVAVQMESRGEINMTELFDALPAETQAQVRAAYPSSNKSLNLGHEFFRMVVQQRLSGRKPTKGRPVLTEQTMPAAVLAKLSAALEKLLTYFRDLAATLKKQKASPDTIARVTAAADMLEAGVRALSSEGSEKSPRAPKKKRAEKARFRLDPENSPVVTALVEAGISPRNPAARLAAMRKKNGGRLSEKDRAVLRNLGEWDNVPRQSDWQGRPIAQDAIRRMVNQSNTNSPDQALQQAAETLGEDPKDFYGRQVWDRVTAELMALDEAPGKLDATDERADAQERQAVEFYAAIENGRVKVNARDLEVGETLIIEGDRVIVQSLETGPDGKLQGITLKDGTRFGVQEIDPSTVLFVEDYAPNDPDWSVADQNEPEVSDNAGSGEAVVTNTPESLAGEKIDKEWTAFAEDSRSLGIPREQMPQIKTEHRGALANFLRAGGIEFKQDSVLPGDLHPTQAEYSPAKVKKAREWNGFDRFILVSSDNHVLDGHHQWLAELEDSPTDFMDVIRLGAPIRELLQAVAQFPSAGMEADPVATVAAPEKDPARESVLPRFNEIAPAAVVTADGQQDFLSGAADEPFNLTAESAADRRAREAKELAADNTRKAREAAKAKKAAESATPELPTLSPAEQEAKDLMNDLLGGALGTQPVAVVYNAPFPREKRANFDTVAGKLLDEGVNTPQKLAESLTRIGIQARQFSVAWWRALGSVDTSLPDVSASEWAAIYSELDKPAAPADTATDDTGTRTGNQSGIPADSGGVAGGISQDEGNAGVLADGVPEPVEGTDGGRNRPTLRPRDGSQNDEADGGTAGAEQSGSTQPGDTGSAGRPDDSGKRTGGGRGGKRGTGKRRPVAVDLVAPTEKASGRPNYHLANPEAIMGGGPKAKFARNQKAIEVYQDLRTANREPTTEELDTLAGYMGWGAFGQELFNGSWKNPAPKPAWEKEDAWLRDHLGQKEWEGLQTSIINAHYTDPPTVNAVWDIIAKLGFKGGRVLEPSMGIGNFFGLMPRGLEAASQLTGIEMDSVSGGMSKILYPEANVQIKPYEQSKTSDNFYDVVVGNWPFSDGLPVDKRYNAIGAVLHDYFFIKALDQTRPGGLVVGITSNGTMDKKGKRARMEMAKRGELVAAFRLPTGAFKEYAGTSVVTDILIFRKTEKPGDPRQSGFLDLQSVPTPSGTDVEINEYFARNPSHILGTLNHGHGTTSYRPGMIVDRKPDLPEQLAAIADKLPEGIKYLPPAPRGQADSYVSNSSNDRQSSIVIDNNELYVVDGEHLKPLASVVKYELKDEKKTARRKEEVAGLVHLRRAVGRLLDAQRKGEDATELRKVLNTQYDVFTQNGKRPINKTDGLSIMFRANDPFAPQLAGLESKEGDKWVKRDIFRKDVLRGVQTLKNPTIADAYAMARNEGITLDLSSIAARASTTVEAVEAELFANGQVFKTPIGTHEPADIYLAGNVREKYREAQDAKDQGIAGMDRNLDALAAVIPADIPYFQIETKVGATWIPSSDYVEFANHLLNTPDGFKIDKVPSGWKIQMDDRLKGKPEATTTWGVPFYSFRKLLAAAMNNATVTVRMPKQQDGSTPVDEKSTKEANAKVEAIREEFTKWVWSDPERAGRLEKNYNEVLNAIATPKYDGSHLAFEGLAIEKGDKPFNLRQHQVNAVWRGVVTNRSLNAHEVGTGKTLVMAGLVMESRRLGRARKPMILAHNANARQVAAEIQSAYPGGKILFVNNFTPDTRAATLAQIALDDWDAVVVPHSLISRLSLRPESVEALVREQIEELEQAAIEAAQEDNAELSIQDMDDPEALKKLRSPTAKELVKEREKIKAMIEKARQLADKPDSVFFEDLGVDMMIVDEAHVFKKLPLATKMKLKGLNKNGSQRGLVLGLLADYVKRTNANGGGIHLFTGTPITNTLNEVFNMMRYIMDDVMKRDGIGRWDDWFNAFAASTTEVELNSASEWEAVERLSSFVNLPELRRMVGQYLDIVFADDMPEFQPRADRAGRTEDAIGRPFRQVVNDIGPMSTAQRLHKQELSARYNRWKNFTGKEKKAAMASGAPEVPIMIEGEGVKASMDYRLIDMQASDTSESKASRAVANILRHYAEHPKSTQMVFMQTGFSDWAERTVRGSDPKRTEKVRVFNVAKDIQEKLIQAGLKPEEIAVFSSLSADERKIAAEKMQQGEIRVAIGSTDTMGTGVNAQMEMRAMHHLDAPWMPGDLEQRNGRGWRQGNRWNTVLEYRYITEGSHDGRRWQILLTKDRFIKLFMKADGSMRTIEGDGVNMEEGEGGGFEETFSAAAGDPRILMREKLNKDVNKLLDKQRSHWQAISDAKNRIGSLRRGIDFKEARIPAMVSDSAAYVEAKEGKFSIVLNGKTYTDREEADKALFEVMDKLPVQLPLKAVEQTKIGQYRGFDLYAFQQVSLSGNAPIQKLEMRREDRYQAGMIGLGSVDYYLRAIATEIERSRAEITSDENSILSLEKVAMTPFGRQAELEKKQKQLSDLVADLSANPTPAPSWLRNGAPVGTSVFVDGKEFGVAGHRVADGTYYVLVDGEAEVQPVDYLKVMNDTGLPIFEAVGEAVQAQSPKRLLEQLGVDTKELDKRTAQAGFEQSGNRTIIDPTRALGAGIGIDGPGNDAILATSDLYADEVTAETVEQWNAAAVEMLSNDYDGTFREITSIGRRGGILSPEQTRAAQMMTEIEARQPMDEKQMRRMQLLVWSNRMAGTEAARSLRARVDPFKTRQERHREAVAKGIFMPPPEVRAELETAQTPEERTVIIAKDGKRIKAIKDALAKMGLTIDDILAGDRMLVARRRDMFKTFVGDRMQGSELAASMDLIDGAVSFEAAASKHGVSPDKLQQTFAQAVADIEKELRRRVAIAAKAKGLTGVLNTQSPAADPFVEFDFGGIAELSPIQQEQAIQRIMQRMGLFPAAQQGKRKVVKRKPLPPAAGGMSLDDYIRMPLEIDPEATQSRLPRVLDPAGRPVDDYAKDPIGRTRPGTQTRIPLDFPAGQPVEMSVVVGADLADVNDVYRLMRIQQAAGSSAFDMMREYWINNLLSGPVTQFKNAFSNLGFGAWNLVASRGMEALLNVVAQNDKSASVGEFGAIMKAIGPAWARGIKLAALAWDTEADHFAHDVLNEQLSLVDTGPAGEYRKVAIGGTKGRIVRLPGRMLMAADGFFKGLFGTMEAGAHAYRIAKEEGLTPGSKAFDDRMGVLLYRPGSQAWVAAVKQAETNTFQNKLDPSQNPIDAVPQMIVSAGQSKHLPIRLLATILFPFTKTPYNVYREGIRRSPLGAVVLAAQMAKAGWVKLQGGKLAPTVPPALIRGLAEQIFAWTGTALLMSAIEGDDDDYEKGFLITGSAPKEKGARELQERAFGGPYVVKIGRTVIPYGGIEPIATVLGTVADFVRSGKTDGTPHEKMNAVFHSVKRGALDKTFLSGLKSMSDLLGMDETSGGPTMAEKARRFALQGIVPNIIRQPLRNSDSRVPDGASNEWWFDAVPLPDGATGRVNPGSGEEKQKTGNAVSRLLIPSAIQPEESVHPVDRALLAWNRANPADSWAPQGASKTLEIGEQRIELNAQALRFLNVRAGTLARKMLAGEPLKGDQESVDKIKDAYSDARKQAREELKARPLDQIGTVKQ